MAFNWQKRLGRSSLTTGRELLTALLLCVTLSLPAYGERLTPVPQVTPTKFHDPVCSSKPEALDSEISREKGDPAPLVATLVRFCDDNGCIIGKLSVGNFSCYTLERPDWFNIPNISCIPAQTYTCRSYSSKKFPETYEVLNVEGRTGILFHGGRGGKVTKYNSKGCITMGLLVNPEMNELYKDADAIKGFLQELAGRNEFTLVIKNECDKPPFPPGPQVTATATPSTRPTG